ncbi:MAG: glycosyltransferase family 9 protein [Desulfuromonadales bacterium]|nr:glycosyltransferase family 9 protein [Desulfuromonadales bacterium]
MFLKKLDEAIGSFLARLWPRPKQPGLLPVPVSSMLLIRPGGIGDAVLLVPVIEHLWDLFPAARIVVLAEKRNSGAFALCPGIDRILCYDRPRELFAALASSYDVVIDTEQWHRLSALVARSTRSWLKIGYATNERRRLFTHPVDYSHDNYEQNSFFELLKPLGIEPPATIPPAFLAIPASDQETADKLLGTVSEQPFVVIFPGASIPERCWGAEKFQQLAIRFLDEGFAVVVVGGKQEIAAGNAIAAGSSALNLADKTSLSGTAGILKRSQLLVSGDSGVLHLGVGLGKPTVSLFGPGIAAKWAPRGEQHIVINHKLPCSPCTRFGTTPPCPIGAKCIQDITVDEVCMAAQELLNLQQKKVNSDAV